MSEQALVLASYGSRGICELPDGERIKCSYRRSVGRPYCGDRVTIDRMDDGSAVVTRIAERTNVFVRADSRRHRQVIAANLDQTLIVIAPRPGPNRDLIERYLVAVHSLGIAPVLIVNKTELIDDSALEAHPALTHLDHYQKLGYPVLETSCKTAPGISALEPVLAHKTNILVGQSGVGKSSLVNALLPDLELQTGALSRVTGKGIHTTTTTIMYTLASGGRLIDSPGVWEYGLWDMGFEELVRGFVEFKPFLGKCKFNDCRHTGEPQCAIGKASADGEIAAWRYESYLRLLSQEN